MDRQRAAEKYAIYIMHKRTDGCCVPSVSHPHPLIPLPTSGSAWGSTDRGKFSDMTIYGHEFCLLPYRTGIDAVVPLGWLLSLSLLVLPNVISDEVNAFVRTV